MSLTVTSVLTQNDVRVINLLIDALELDKNDEVVIDPYYTGGIALFDGKIYKNHKLIAEFQSDITIKIHGAKTDYEIPWPKDSGLGWFVKQLSKIKL